MIITLDKFIRKHCVRKKEHIVNPPVNDIKDFVLPKNSQLHFLGMDGDEIGILATNPLLSYQEKGKVVSEFVVGYSNDKAGGFKTVTKDTKEPVRDYFRRNKGIVNGIHSKSDILLDKNLLVTNYGLMDAGVKYFNNPYAWWLRFQNHWGSIFDYVAKAVNSNRRNHFIIIDIPTMFPSVAQLKRFEADESNDNVRKIANSERMLIAQFWNWFNPKAKSIVPKGKALHSRLFFVFRYHDKWICTSMNTIEEHLKSSDNPRGSYSELQLKKNFLIMLLTMILGKVDDVVLDEDETPDVPAEVVDAEEEVVKARRETIDSTTSFSSSPEGNAASDIKDAITVAVTNAIQEVEEVDAYEAVETKRSKKVDKILDQIENANIEIVEANEDINAPEQTIVKGDDGEDLNAEVTERVSIDRSEIVIDYKGYSPKDMGHEERFNEKLKSHALKGAITPQQLKRFEKLAANYKVIPDPITGTSTLEKASIITKEDLIVTKDKKFAEKVNMVADSSMLSSTLLDFDSQYIDKVMNKDIYNAVMSVQNHGVAIQNYQTKRVKQLGDDYTVHSVKLVPIEGEPSTVTFKVPTVDQNGVFQSRSIKMRMKKQRVDRMNTLIM